MKTICLFLLMTIGISTTTRYQEFNLMKASYDLSPGRNTLSINTRTLAAGKYYIEIYGDALKGIQSSIK